jgi:hypothetical protein
MISEDMQPSSGTKIIVNMEEQIIQDAFAELFPDRDFFYKASLQYSGRFKSLNGQIRLSGNDLTIKLSRMWKEVSPDIKIGIIQYLLKKLFKYKGPNTLRMDLYNSFAKQMSDNAPVTVIDPILEKAFHRVNIKYFSSSLEIPNMKWGTNSHRKLASYDYTTDTVSVSKIFKSDDIPKAWIQYLVYHELLHKKLKYHSSGNRNYHHTAKFKQMEEQFEDFKKVDCEIKAYLRALSGKKKRVTSFFDFF